jgi:hypothetical protein
MYSNPLIVNLHQVNWAQRLMLALSKGVNRVAVSLHSPEDGNRSNLGNVFSNYLELRTMGKVHTPGDCEHVLCYEICLPRECD